MMIFAPFLLSISILVTLNVSQTLSGAVARINFLRHSQSEKAQEILTTRDALIDLITQSEHGLCHTSPTGLIWCGAGTKHRALLFDFKESSRLECAERSGINLGQCNRLNEIPKGNSFFPHELDTNEIIIPHQSVVAFGASLKVIKVVALGDIAIIARGDLEIESATSTQNDATFIAISRKSARVGIDPKFKGNLVVNDDSHPINSKEMLAAQKLLRTHEIFTLGVSSIEPEMGRN